MYGFLFSFSSFSLSLSLSPFQLLYCCLVLLLCRPICHWLMKGLFPNCNEMQCYSVRQDVEELLFVVLILCRPCFIALSTCTNSVFCTLALNPNMLLTALTDLFKTGTSSRLDGLQQAHLLHTNKSFDPCTKAELHQ